MKLTERMNQPFQKTTTRLGEVDFLRGIAILLMVTYHIFYDLAHFGVLTVAKRFAMPPLFWKCFPKFSSTLFLVLVGISAVLSMNYSAHLPQKLLRRSFQILACAGLVTVGSLFGPQRVVYFGILHCIGVSLLMIYPFLRFRFLNLFLGVGILALDLLGARVSLFAPPWLMFLGFKPRSLHTGDYFPLIPYFGLVLIGVFLGKVIYLQHDFTLADHPRLEAGVQSSFGKNLQRLGRHSLIIYLIHQPALMSLFYLLGWMRFR